MRTTTFTLMALMVLVVSSLICGAGVDLSPDGKGDRIAVVKDGKVAYLPAKRVNIGSKMVGGGHCRYIKRSKNGDLYVTGPRLGLFRSKDGGRSWANLPLNIPGRSYLAGFTILRNGDFLIAFRPGNDIMKEVNIARSIDNGRTWKVSKMNGKIRPYKFITPWNNELLELADGTILMSTTLRHHMDRSSGHDILPEHFGIFEYVFHSYNGGRTWPHRSMVAMYGAESHLLQLPSGKTLACIRKQRSHRVPGDAASVQEFARRYGWTPAASTGFVEDGETESRFKNMFVSESYDGGYTWVNEQQVSEFMQCSGDMSYLQDGTLVLQYLHRYNGSPRVGRTGIRARVSYNQGKTWEAEEYILSNGENYPGGIDMPDGGMISMVPHNGQIQAVHWRPLAKHQSTPTYVPIPPIQQSDTIPLSVVRETHISVITEAETTKRPATAVNILPAPSPGVRHSEIRYRRNSAIIQRSGNGDLYCTGNILGSYALISKDGGRTWKRRDFGIEGWGSLVGFKILRDGSFLIVYEPVGGGCRSLYTARSTDQGKTWDSWKAKLDVAPFAYVSGKDNNLVELPDGTLLVALRFWGGRYGSVKKKPEIEGESLAYVLRSRDGGRTWEQPGSICSLSVEGAARLVRLNSGKLLACVYQTRSNQLMLADSDNDGRTWTNPRAVAVEVNPGGDTGNLTVFGNGSVVLQFLYDFEAGKGGHSNWQDVEGLRAIISHDEGQTWEKEVYVIASQMATPGTKPSGHGAYLSDSVELADGRILTACVNNHGKGMRFQGITWSPLPNKK